MGAEPFHVSEPGPTRNLMSESEPLAERRPIHNERNLSMTETGRIVTLKEKR
jgi:hypothetical protein